MGPREPPVDLPGGLFPPKPHEGGQPGPALTRRDLGGPELQSLFLQEGPLSGEVQVRDVPGLMEALGHVERDRERLDDRNERCSPYGPPLIFVRLLLEVLFPLLPELRDVEALMAERDIILTYELGPRSR
jgi:hypothetical protein